MTRCSLEIKFLLLRPFRKLQYKAAHHCSDHSSHFCLHCSSAFRDTGHPLKQ